MAIIRFKDHLSHIGYDQEEAYFFEENKRLIAAQRAELAAEQARRQQLAGSGHESEHESQSAEAPQNITPLRKADRPVAQEHEAERKRAA